MRDATSAGRPWLCDTTFGGSKEIFGLLGRSWWREGENRGSWRRPKWCCQKYQSKNTVAFFCWIENQIWLFNWLHNPQEYAESASMMNGSYSTNVFCVFWPSGTFLWLVWGLNGSTTGQKCRGHSNWHDYWFCRHLANPGTVKAA